MKQKKKLLNQQLKKTTTKPATKKEDAKVVAKPVTKKAPVKKAAKSTKPLTETQKRALIDGSADITESRQELQKTATEIRTAAKKAGINFKADSLREMTKKEVLDHIKSLKKSIK
ncbi:hypothetical protein [[Acholeplasma] multilocale]|uniref:hypothetical protein n=1 Tax=[Acholeplasma] multilocale TaxID=264638 RepID=UPI00047A542E|nr:hypothetical protein [[Acholeplasma] multilocale]